MLRAHPTLLIPAQMGDWTFNPACWPDPQGMVTELASMGIELMVVRGA
jgi:alpha-glucosidase (family GH31 glycosyl hydrolase)